MNKWYEMQPKLYFFDHMVCQEMRYIEYLQLFDCGKNVGISLEC